MFFSILCMSLRSWWYVSNLALFSLLHQHLNINHFEFRIQVTFAVCLKIELQFTFRFPNLCWSIWGKLNFFESLLSFDFEAGIETLENSIWFVCNLCCSLSLSEWLWRNLSSTFSLLILVFDLFISLILELKIELAFFIARLGFSFMIFDNFVFNTFSLKGYMFLTFVSD